MSTDTGLPADAHSVESRRQRAIEALGLGVPLEQRRDERFDRITRLARTVFRAPLASITVLDGDCAWFPSAQGFEAAVMPREDVFCDRTHRVGEVTVVPDATLDSHYAHLPIVVDGGVRFYAGAPCAIRSATSSAPSASSTPRPAPSTPRSCRRWRTWPRGRSRSWSPPAR